MSSSSKIQKILVVQTAFLGDVILYFPFLRELKKLYPKAELHLVVREGLGRFVLEQGAVDYAYEVKKGDLRSYNIIGEKLSRSLWDLIFCPHPSLRSALWVARFRAREKIAFSSLWNSFFFSKRVAKPKGACEVLKGLSLLTAVSLEWSTRLRGYLTLDLISPDVFGQLPAIPPELKLLDDAKGQVRTVEAIKASQGRVAIFPGSVWPTKRWKKNYFAEIATWLHQEKKVQVYWLGSASEAKLCLELTQAVPGSIFFRVESVYERSSLSQVVDFLRTVELVISNDSGGQHLGALADTKVLTLFGPTVLAQGFRPWALRASIAELSGLRCRPCGAHGHRACPIKTHECMEGLLPVRVKQVIDHLMIGWPGM
jgi:heptosyltransferase-2